MNEGRIGTWIRRLDEQNAAAQIDRLLALRRLIFRNREYPPLKLLATACSHELALEHWAVDAFCHSISDLYLQRIAGWIVTVDKRDQAPPRSRLCPDEPIRKVIPQVVVTHRLVVAIGDATARRGLGALVLAASSVLV
jgi:hypothetical protein